MLLSAKFGELIVAQKFSIDINIGVQLGKMNVKYI